MTTAVTVRVPTGTLRWARLRAAASEEEAAHKCGHSVEEFAEWEAATSDPPLSALRDLAELFDVPLSAFLLSNPPTTPPLTVERRVFAGAYDARTTISLAKALNRAVAIQQLAVELQTDAGSQTGLSPVAQVSATELARDQRGVLGITYDEQRLWDDEYQALRAWRMAVESHGVFVLQMPMPDAHVRAFSLAEDPPLVVLNRSDFPRARAFSLLHEYGHILLGSAGICEPGTGRRAMVSEPERYCNTFAGAVLVPSSTLVRDQDALDVRNLGDVPHDSTVDRIANRYKVSRGVIWYRLHDVGFTSDQVFERKWDDWGDFFPARGEGGGGATTAQAVLRDLGPSLTQLVLRASDAGAISTTDASQYMGVSADKIGSIRDELTRWTAGVG